MDGYTAQLQAEAAESEGILPQRSEPSTPRTEEQGTSSNSGTGGSKQTEAMDTLPSLSSVFGFAASWGKKLQADLQLDQFVDQVKKQSEEVTKAYTQDIAEFAQAVKTGAARGMDELSTRFSQIKTDIEAEFAEDKPVSDNAESEQLTRAVGEPSGREDMLKQQGLFGGIGRHFQVDALRQQQDRAKRLMSKLGADLEDLLRDAIVIEAPGSASTEEQKTAARKIIYDRRMAQLAAVQESEDTYLVDPSSRTEYAEFIKQFALDRKKDQTGEILKDNGSMGDMIERLVPQKVSQDEFWTRYFFHEWMIDQEEARRRKLVEAAVAATAEDEDDFSWDAEDDEKEKPADSSKASGSADSGADAASDAKPKLRAAEPKASGNDEARSSAVPEDAAEPSVETSDKSEDKKKSEASDKSGEDKKNAGNNDGSGGDDDGWDEWE